MRNSFWNRTHSVRGAVWLVYLVFLIIAPASYAQVTGSGLNTKVSPLTNGTFTITGGTRPDNVQIVNDRSVTSPGTNLFHSFDAFSLKNGETALFSNPSNLPTNNIFSRVTGNSQSIIDGKIDTRTEFPTANFWLMNPNGIIFNSHASLNIGGAATFTTANSLNFDNEGSFSIGSDISSLGRLAVASVVSFGFITFSDAYPNAVLSNAVLNTSANQDVSTSTPVPGIITIDGSTLSAPSLSFVGGPISITGAKLSATNGAVNISSIGAYNQIQSEYYARVDLLNNDVQNQSHRIAAGQPGSIVLSSGAAGADASIDARSAIQLNGVIYSGTTATGYIGTNLTAPGPEGEPSIIVIKEGSLQVANLPQTQLIVSSPVVKSLTPDTTLDVGGNGPLTVTLNHAFTKQVDVQVKSDNTDVVSVTPAAVTVPAGSNSAPVTPGVHGLAPGTTSVKASAGRSAPAGALVQVTFPSSSVAPNPSTLTEGDGGTLIVTLVRPALENVTVTFTSSNPSVLKAPDPVQIPARQSSSIPVQFSTLQSGSATITASLQVASRPVGNTVSAPIQVNTVPLTSLAPNLSIIEANNGTLIVTLTKQPPHPVTVTFTSSNPDAVPAPGAINIDPTQTSGAVTVRAQHPGSTTITASYGTGSVSAPVVVNPPPIMTFAPNLTVSSNTTGTVTITLAAPSSRDVRVALDSSNTGVAKPDPFVIIPAGQKSVTAPVHGLAAGTATITASEGNSTASTNVQILDTSLSNSVAAGKALTQPQTQAQIQALPSTYANQLIMAADRCVGSKTGEFSSFVQRGRDAAPPQPGGMLSSPLGVQTGTPKVSGLSLLPASSITRGQGALNLAPGVAAFLQLNKGC